ncbi:MAG TPA: RNA polymerase sigma factor [Planctomycetota bacterium]|nr:RNA polymerase sigma factor [Planctomycetota bacterium]
MAPQQLDELVARVQRGDKDAYGDVVHEIQRELRIFIAAYAASLDMVDEVTQATLVSVYENIRRYELRGTFLAWVKGIGRNLLLKHLHEQARVKQLEGSVLEAALSRACIASAEAAGEPSSMQEKLRDCLAKLQPTARELIQKKYVESRSVKDIAAVLKKSESWVAVTLFRVREALRLCMTRNEGAA